MKLSSVQNLLRKWRTLLAPDGGPAGWTARSEHFVDSILEQGEEPLPGTHIVSPRLGYLHHGIYVGHGRVVHYAGLARGFFRGPVEEVSLAQFARGRIICTRRSKKAGFDRAEVVRRARSRVGEDGYRIFHNNCEHFCEWCLNGEPRSYQIERLLSSRRARVMTLGLITALGRDLARTVSAPR